ncbi:YdcF family protein [Butyrivibrio sp. AE2032]|uniref:YdcF family protein n=1 Tax=Butyrivibrio sp. AE2032 TaxID=1458463 RepID=UPI0006913253|nr:YdcF family protein [Butyrivibrio sp. AE2032]
MINKRTGRSALRKISSAVAACMMVTFCGCNAEPGTAVTSESSKPAPATEATTTTVETTAAEITETSEIPETVTGDPETIRKYVEEMVVDYGSYGEDADGKIDELLSKLSSEDTDAGIRWTTIMDLWRSEDLGQPLNYDVLPDGLPDTDELCIVVLGFQLNPDGSMKDELINRLNVAYNSAVKYPDSYIVCTGGGTASGNASATEAGMMASWLIDQGIDAKRVIVEDDSLTTAQNAIYTYDILTSDYPSVKYIAIVSSDYHIATGELLFSAEAVLRSGVPGEEKLKVISNASWDAPSGYLSPMFQAGALIELSGDMTTAFDIYYDNYDIHELPPIN